MNVDQREIPEQVLADEAAGDDASEAHDVEQEAAKAADIRVLALKAEAAMRVYNAQLVEAWRTIRRRINVSTSTRGVKTWDCTVEATGLSDEEMLRLSDNLVEELERRYPAPLA